MVTTSDDDGGLYVSRRDPKLKTAEINSAPHPELWPAPLTPEGAEKIKGVKTEITVVPATPNVNLEYTMKAAGLPVNSGLTWRLSGAEPETWLTHKSDGEGNAHVVWRTRSAGSVKVEIFSREPAETGSKLVSESFDVIDSRDDTRLGEDRGTA